MCHLSALLEPSTTIFMLELSQIARFVLLGSNVERRQRIRGLFVHKVTSALLDQLQINGPALQGLTVALEQGSKISQSAWCARQVTTAPKLQPTPFLHPQDFISLTKESVMLAP